MTNDKLVDEPLIAKGISRLADAGRAVGIAFNRRPTDDEMRMIHDLLRDPFALRAERPQSGEMVMVLKEVNYRFDEWFKQIPQDSLWWTAEDRRCEKTWNKVRAVLAAFEEKS